MQIDVQKADSSGTILQAGRDCVGFMLMPAAPSRNDASNSNLKAQPGSFPVRVRPRGGGAPILVPASHAYYFDPGYFPRGFDLLDCDANDLWLVVTFDSRTEGIVQASRGQRVPVRVQDSVVLAAADPATSTDGFAMRPGMKRVTTYFGGTARQCTLWVRQLDGTWFNTGEVVDNTLVGAVLYDAREIAVPGDRFYWRPNGAAQSVVIEAEYEVG